MSRENVTKRVLSFTLLLFVIFLSGCTTREKTKETNIRDVEEKNGEAHIRVVEKKTQETDIEQLQKKCVSVQQQWGIEVQSISLSSANYMLDFRYKVIDPAKAAPLLRRPVESYVIDQASGSKLIVPRPPKVGSLRQTTMKPEAERIYFVMFANPGKFVKPGNKVTVAIGDMRISDLVVN